MGKKSKFDFKDSKYFFIKNINYLISIACL